MSHVYSIVPARSAGPIAGLVAVAGLAVGLPGCYDGCRVVPAAQTLRVTIEDGARQTSTGQRVAYSLFTPQPDETLPAPPFPAVVLSHGFARSKQLHRHTAATLAEQGIIVLTPNLTSLLGGETARTRNIESLVDHVRWLRARAANEHDALFGRLDPNRIALVGHSAGGAISFEAAIELADAGEPVSAVMLLDGVPWSRTLARAGQLRDVAFASVRSEPSDCNANGAILDLLAGLAFATEDLRIVGASHCDPEDPTDCVCELVCQGSTAEARAAYQELLAAFLHDVFGTATGGFNAAVERLAAAGRVVRTPIGGQVSTSP